MKQAATAPLHPARAVVIHGHADALLALTAAAAAPCRLVLLSAPGAAGFLGAGWWLALIRSLQPRMQPLGASDLLDCGAAAGRAMEALRLGQRRLVLSPECPQYQAVLARALALSADMAPMRPPALDLAGRQAARQLAGWLDPQPDPPLDPGGIVTSGGASSRS